MRGRMPAHVAHMPAEAVWLVCMRWWLRGSGSDAELALLIPYPPLQVLLFTERAQFYNRNRISGIKVGSTCGAAGRPRSRGQHAGMLQCTAASQGAHHCHPPPWPGAHPPCCPPCPNSSRLTHPPTYRHPPTLSSTLPPTRPPLLLQDVLFYQLPEHAHFYSELLNLLEDSASAEHTTVSVLFGRGDALRLERVVGSARSGRMLKGSTTAFLFC